MPAPPARSMTATTSCAAPRPRCWRAGRDSAAGKEKAMTMRDDDTLPVLDMHAVDGLLGLEQVSEAVAEAFLLHSRAQGRVFPVIRERLHTGEIGRAHV